MTTANFNELNLVDRVIHVNRVAKVVKGGRRFSFSAIVVAGDRNSWVGYGLGKANEVPEAIRKGVEQAKRNLIQISIVNGTIPCEIIGRYGASKVFLKPASEGTGVIAGGAIKAVIESAGIKNILTKCLGSHNPHNTIKATFNAFKQLKKTEEIQKKLSAVE
ncbi:MAG: 30S ribosomal protein S5 [Deltaproteobacteria bacterium DG_8]|nr:MAG: 30S ribosomal protein S5 [Deltaproteobacteria bacterium DG_8]